MPKQRATFRRSVKHRHGTPNPIILSEENALFAAIDRALESSGNAQVIGRNGEIPLRHFFNRYLPFTLRAVTGHFVTPGGQLSPQIDILVLDARYPLLAENPDGSVLAMLHAVLATIEVKTRMTTRDVVAAWLNAQKIMNLASEVKSYGDPAAFGSVQNDAVAYRIAQRLEPTEVAYIRAARPDEAGLDVYVLRVPGRDQAPGRTLGAELHMEPVEGPERFIPMCRLSHTALSDIYYRLVQDAYYTLAHRNWSHGAIGRQLMEYMAWATFAWDDYEAILRRRRPSKRPNPTASAGHTRWPEAAERRLDELESGEVAGIPAGTVIKKARATVRREAGHPRGER